MNKQKRTIGFVKSHKENEHRIALLPRELSKIGNVDSIFLEQGYGNYLGIDDSDYMKFGAHLVARDMVLTQDIICEPKIGDSDFLEDLSSGQTIFGWIHAMQSRKITKQLTRPGISAIAWENMNEHNQHTFWRNNELAGEAAILHAYSLMGQMPYETKVALIGRGCVAFGALRVLQGLGAEVTVYRRNQEGLFSKHLSDYDVIVNATLWDLNREDHLITKEELRKMKSQAVIIDISADVGGGIETSKITDFSHPTYVVDGITHYVVDHTPSILYKTASSSISEAIEPFLDDLIEGKANSVIDEATIIKNGVAVNQEMVTFQK